ncbi:hypothetical protein C7271_05320 [filamentous cyanobacterium CCP5]|nr:hypothetical protein C7271_05320 [filamentous cyanobacterium CCP5]
MPRSSLADHQRIYRIYHYLCACLAIKRKSDGTPNATGTSNRLNRAKDFRKTVGLVFQGEDVWLKNVSQSSKTANLTTGDVVEMLGNLHQSLQEDYRAYEEPYTRVLTISDILTALYHLVELTPQERDRLGLSAGDGLTLLQRAVLILQVIGGLENYEMLFRIYKAAVGLDFTNAEPALENLHEVDELIAKTVEKALSYLPDLPHRRSHHSESRQGKQETVLQLTQKAQREIRRLMARSGNQQSLIVGSMVVNSYVQHYLQPAFVAKLAQTVVANERLTDQFPVYLKRVTIEASGPLPFADRELGILQGDGPYAALLHPALRRLERKSDGGHSKDLPGPGDYELASQEATRVIGEFYLKVPEGYQPEVQRVFQKIASEDGQRIDFSVSSTGIGGSLSHVIKVINRAILLDLPCLNPYFSIAHDVTSTQTIIRENVASPIWAHSLVKLCHKRTVGQTLQACGQEQLRFYEAFAFADPIGHGDYCGFDFLIAQAQAALQARLQAIRNAGVSSEDYLQHLCHRIERTIALENAWSYLRGYPFSSFAMIGAIDQEILQPTVGDRPLTREDPYVCFDACLSTVEALLDEGVYRRAWKYLERLEVLNGIAHQGLTMTQTRSGEEVVEFEVFSGALIIRYLLCQANYFYIYDPNDRDPSYLPPGCGADINREVLTQRAWKVLDQAQQHVWLRLRKYVVINEVSQGTFHPHYCLLARIVFLRMKLLVFFPRFVPQDDRYLPTERFSGQQRTEASIHWGRLFLAEKARLYAAADGDSEIYACYAACQCWLHLMAAFAPVEQLNLPARSGSDLPERGLTLSAEQCIDWAKKLRDHALISYADMGRYYYNQIKEKSGLPGELENFGSFRIQKLQAIYEARGQQYAEWTASSRDVLVLDMSLLSVTADDLPKLAPKHPDRSIYLFGTNACYLFFARGLYLLCSNDTQEFQANAPDQPIDWEPKLRLAMRLLDMAWAIAEDGGHVAREENSPERMRTIHRTQSDPEAYSETPYYSTPDVDSVRDLYPRRINEIVDLSKVFSAASMVLRLGLTSQAERSQLRTDIDRLLDTLQSTNRLNRTVRALLSRQTRYNSHLQPYLDQAKTILQRQAATAMVEAAAPDMPKMRDRLLRELFSALIQ